VEDEKTDQDYTLVNELNRDFKYEISKQPGGENIRYCFACGTCTASCPVRAIDAKYNPRKIIRMCLLGMKDRVLASDFIWLCSNCYTCHERCPQDVGITEVMNVLKNMAVKEGHLNSTILRQVRQIASKGRLFDIDEFDNARRKKLGLPPLRNGCDEVKKIFEITGADKSVEE
jgi:heterodisulfide reductase subunit C